MPTTIDSYKNTKYGAVGQFGTEGDQGAMSMLGGMGGGGEKEPVQPETYYDPASKKEIPVAFKLRSGNTSAFKMLGSSPAKFFGAIGRASSVFGGGISGWMDKIRAKREARRNKRLGLNAAAPGGGGGDGAHTHGTGGEAIGGAQAVTAQAAAPVEPGVEEEEVV